MGCGQGGMGTRGWGKVAKYLLLAINAVIIVLSISALVLALWTLETKSFVNALTRNKLYLSATYSLLILGLLALVTALTLGLFGVCKELKVLLLGYSVTTLVLCVSAFFAGLIAVVFTDQLSETFRPELRYSAEVYGEQTEQSVTLAWDETQQRLQCCGVALPELKMKPWLVWRLNKHINQRTDDQRVPSSCCREQFEKCDESNPVSLEQIHVDDCYQRALEFAGKHATMLAIFAFVFAFVLVVGSALSLVLFKCIV